MYILSKLLYLLKSRIKLKKNNNINIISISISNNTF